MQYWMALKILKGFGNLEVFFKLPFIDEKGICIIPICKWYGQLQIWDRTRIIRTMPSVNEWNAGHVKIKPGRFSFIFCGWDKTGRIHVHHVKSKINFWQNNTFYIGRRMIPPPKSECSVSSNTCFQWFHIKSAASLRAVPLTAVAFCMSAIGSQL